MANATIKVKGPGADCTKTGVANTYGVYSVNVGSCSGPFLISAESAAGKIFSVATGQDIGKIVNATPLTTLVASRVLNSIDMDSVNTATINFDADNVNAQVSVISNVIASIAERFGASSVDIRSGVFAADGKALDKVLDAINVKPSTGSVMEIAIKGSTASVSVPVDSTVPVTDVIDESEVDEAEAVMTEFDLIKNFYITSFNACLAKKEESCFKSFYHTDYVQNGHVGPDSEWNDIYWPGMDIKYFDLILIEMNEEKDQAWIAFSTTEKQDDGKYYGWSDVAQLKKEGGAWKIYGNQIPKMVEAQPSVLKFGDNIETQVVRGLNFRSMDWMDEDGEDAEELRTKSNEVYNFTVTSADFGITSPVTVDHDLNDNFEVASGKPSCSSTNDFCKSFLVTGSAKAVNYPKIRMTFNGTNYDIYVPTLPSKPKTADEVPAFLAGNLSHGESICKEYPTGTEFPTSLNTLKWTIVPGYHYEGFDMSSSMTANMDIDFDRSNSVIEIPFGSNLSRRDNFEIMDMGLRIEFRNSQDRAYFLTYTCESVE